MTDGNNIKNFTAADIEKYHRGLLSSKEKHDLEKAALDDPFLADALEGYAITGVNVGADITELKKRLAEKTETAKVIPFNKGGGSSFPWLRIAVMILLIAGAAFLSYQFLFKNNADDKIAERGKSQKENAKNKDSIENNLASSPKQDTSPVPSNETVDRSITVSSSDKTVDERKTVKDELNKNNAVFSDTVKDNLAVETNAPSANVVKTEDKKQADDKNKALNDEVTSQRADISATDGAKLKKVTATRPEDKNADGVIDNLEKENRLNEVIVSGNANRRVEGFIQKPALYPNTKIFRGRVTDANNNALPFANITNTQDNVGTYSDAKGNFTLISTDSLMNVQVRSTGFENSTVQLRNNVTENSIVMQEDRGIAVNVLDSSKRNFTRRRNGTMTLEEPEPADGWRAYDSYLANNLNMPDNFDKKKTGEADAVEVSFEVNKYGDPVNIKVEKSLCDQCDKEAVRLIQNGPKWKRKARKGKATVIVPFNQ